LPRRSWTQHVQNRQKASTSRLCFAMRANVPWVGLQRANMAGPAKKLPTAADADAPFVASLPRVQTGAVRRQDGYHDTNSGSETHKNAQHASNRAHIPRHRYLSTNASDRHARTKHTLCPNARATAFAKPTQHEK
jgi:hypothetical protein